MKILDKIKSLVPFKKKQNIELSICEFVLHKIEQAKHNENSRPVNLTHQEWRAILDDMAFGFKVKQTNSILKSPMRKRQRQQKVERAFKLFEVYIKHL